MVGLVFLLVSSGLALTVSVHQVVWLFGAGEPLVTSSSRALDRVISTNNLKENGLAFHNHAEEHGAYPPGGSFRPRNRGTAHMPTPGPVLPIPS